MSAGTSPTAHELSAAALRNRVNQAYAAQTRESLEEKRILDFLPLVRHIVQKIAAQMSRRVDVDNLISAGTLGLVKAARSFDSAKNAEFKTYAYIRIRGAIIDELRSDSFVPTAVHRQVRMTQQAYQRFFEREGRMPGDEELASELGVTAEQLYRTLEEARRQQFLSIHGLSTEEGQGDLVPADASPGPQHQVERQEMVENLVKAMTEMSARDRQILLLYYERDLTMKEIAEVLEVTESRVSQLHASALFKLSMKMRTPP